MPPEPPILSTSTNCPGSHGGHLTPLQVPIMYSTQFSPQLPSVFCRTQQSTAICHSTLGHHPSYKSNAGPHGDPKTTLSDSGSPKNMHSMAPSTYKRSHLAFLQTIRRKRQSPPPTYTPNAAALQVHGSPSSQRSTSEATEAVPAPGARTLGSTQLRPQPCPGSLPVLDDTEFPLAVAETGVL